MRVSGSAYGPVSVCSVRVQTGKMGGEMLNIISLGAGVQSSTMALMAAHGEIMPMPDCAIFADTQAEPKAVYLWLDWLEKQLPFPVHRVTVGSLRDQIINSMNGIGKRTGRPPFFTGKGGMLNRQCTQDFKITPIQRKVGELIGHKPRTRWPREIRAEQWIGISTDEAHRMKPSQISGVRHRWPLIEKDISRADCLAWMVAREYPKPSKSACTFCPYHDAAMWRDMKINDQESWADAVAVDEAIRPGHGLQRNREQWFLHRQRVPLAEVDMRTAKEAGQEDMFGEDCTGLCGT